MMSPTIAKIRLCDACFEARSELTSDLEVADLKV